ncbi:MAG TPA: 5-(carboxyamino)imidazole ribonucleotide synthase [Stellaceae bacterium]|jgi:5-(carboxyamino)imidazole ribonucleotide synthase|nr:5-(carboxyamino)imidazole ribonucleotide synthase [Stellaceae bacterium]
MSLAPGAVIGILGGGQLGRMTALAAAALGYRCHVFADETQSPASQVCAAATVAPFTDADALARFAAAVDVATFEFENIPAEAVQRVAAAVPVMPRPEILEITQDRLREKGFLRSIGTATTEFRAIENPAALPAALAALGAPAVLKSVRMGYDGKGQVTIADPAEAAEAWRRMGSDLGILEAFVDFVAEISVVVARGADGAVAAYPSVENRHVNHILDTTVAPADLPAKIRGEAEAIARHIAEKLDLVGVLAVEMFVAKSGALLVNELAPRPHNSGHWTIDACLTSQFEQLVRAVCGLPLGSTERHSDAVMKNLIGDEVSTWPDALKDPSAKLHLYGKAEVKPGRKMGHVTRLLPRT